MTDFLQSSVLPGEVIPKHEHRRMLTVLIIIVIAAVLFVLGYLWKSSKDSAVNIIPTNSVVKSDIDPVAQHLLDSAISISEQDKIDSARSLNRAAIPLTEKQKEDLLLKK